MIEWLNLQFSESPELAFVFLGFALRIGAYMFDMFMELIKFVVEQIIEFVLKFKKKKP